MFDYRWYQDVFLSRVMLRKDCHKPYWKEKFIDGLPPIFAHKVKQELMDKNDSIDYDNLTYGDILSTFKKLGINMCNDEKLLKYQLKNKRKAKYEMGNFCEQYGLPLLLLLGKKGKNMIKVTKVIAIKNLKNKTLLNLMIFMLKRKMFLKNMIHKGQVKVNVLTVVKLDILIKTANKNVVS